jgi:hypothetical protein
MDLNFDLKYLQAELSRIDLLIQRQVRRWQLAGQDPTDAFRGLHLSDEEAQALVARPFCSNWGELVTLSPEERQVFAQHEAEAVRQVQKLAETGQEQGRPPRLVRLASTFGLNRFELDLLLVCLAPALDLRYERLYGYLQDDVTRKRPTVNLALDLLAQAGPTRLLQLTHFTDESPVFKYHLLEINPEAVDGLPLLSRTLQVDQALVSWLLGRYEPHADLGSYAGLLQRQAGPSEADRLLAGDVSVDLARLSEHQGVAHLVFYGPDRASQQAAARLLAAQLGRPLLVVDLAPLVREGLPALRALRLALRDARLTNALPCLLGWDACLLDGEAPSGEVLTELCSYPEPVIVAGEKSWQARGIDRDRPLLWFEFPNPPYAQRLQLWHHFLQGDQPAGSDVVSASKQPAGKLSESNQGWDVTALAGQFVLTTGQTRDVVAMARDKAVQRGTPLTTEDLFIAARAHSNPRLANLARKIVPRYDWQDMILPPDQRAILQEIIATVRGRPVVLETWGVGRKLASSAGVTVLFAGPPGTGKTMAAEIIARALNLDLYKIDLSTIVSKYIGETEKNLEKIFEEAQSSNAILFFDEADAIFGKRSEVKDAHDRYANIEVSYLLQRMEAYDGVTILATNLRANLDEAFTRRLQFAVDFPFPEADDRQRIWETLFPPDVPRQPELDFELLARRFKLAGGNIRNVIVSAAYLAAADGEVVTMAHILHGIRRELQKMGRLVNESDLRIGER